MERHHSRKSLWLRSKFEKRLCILTAHSFAMVCYGRDLQLHGCVDLLLYLSSRLIVSVFGRSGLAVSIVKLIKIFMEVSSLGAFVILVRHGARDRIGPTKQSLNALKTVVTSRLTPPPS